MIERSWFLESLGLIFSPGSSNYLLQHAGQFSLLSPSPHSPFSPPHSCPLPVGEIKIYSSQESWGRPNEVAYKAPSKCVTYKVGTE